MIESKFTYLENGIYVITEEERPDLTPASLPWDLYSDDLKIATGYIRWSDKKQNSGHSHAIQERAILIKARSLGFQVVVMFVEAAKSGYHYSGERREKISLLKEFILSNANANSVIFYDESRMCRDITGMYTGFILPLREKKTQLKLYSTQHEGEWNENDPMVQARLTFAYQESNQKAQNVRGTLKTIFEKENKRPPSSFPYGYSQGNEEEDLVPNENAGIVGLIFYLYSYGYSDNKIAELLELAQVPSPMGYRNWSDASVRYILNNIFYIGNLVWDARMSFSNSKKKPIEELNVLTNDHQPLIEMGLWETTQFFRNLKSNKIQIDSPFILKDLVICKDCGEKLKTKNQKSAKSKTDCSIYSCPICKCKIKKDLLNQNVIEDFAVRWGREIKHYPKLLNNKMNSWKKDCKNKVETLSDEIKKLTFTKDNLKSTDRNYEDLQKIIELQLSSKEKEKTLYINTVEKIEHLIKDKVTIELLDRFKEDIHSYSNAEKRSILLLSVKQISYDFKRNFFEIDYRLTPYVDIETAMSAS